MPSFIPFPDPRHPSANVPSSRAGAPQHSRYPQTTQILPYYSQHLQIQHYHPPQPQMQPHDPPPPSVPPPPSNDQGFAAHMRALASTLEAQPRIIMEAFASHFAALRADIDSLKASFDSVQATSSKVQHDVSKMSTEIANMSETLSTVVRAQNSSLTRPPTLAESSATPPSVQSGRAQMKSQGPVASMDVEILNSAVQHEAQAESCSSARSTLPRLPAPPPISESSSADSSICSFQRQGNYSEAARWFSKVAWGMEDAAPSQPTPVPPCQFQPPPQRLSRTPLRPHAGDNPNNSSPHPFFSDSRPCSAERNEVQQLPSPPEILTHSQSEEASVQIQLHPDSQCQSQLPHRHVETTARPINLGPYRLSSSSSVSSSMSSSTGLFSPISPSIPAGSRGENILKFLGPHGKDMPIASFAMTDELPELQYPSEPEKDASADAETNTDEEMNGLGESSIREVQMMVEEGERAELAHPQRGPDDEPHARSCPPTPLVEETRHPEVAKELQPRQSMKQKTPLFLPDSCPSSVQSMSPDLKTLNKVPVEEIIQQEKGELSPQRRQRETEEDQVTRNLIVSSQANGLQRQPQSPAASSPRLDLPPSSPPFHDESQSSSVAAVEKLLTELTPRKDREGSLGGGPHSSSPAAQRGNSSPVVDRSQRPYYDHLDEEGEEHRRRHSQDQQVSSPDSSCAVGVPPISTSSDEIDCVAVQLTTLTEIESSEESDDEEEGEEEEEEEEEEEMDELLSSHEDDLYPHCSSDGVVPEAAGTLESQVHVARTLLTESQMREEGKEIMEDSGGQEEGQVEFESETQLEVEGMVVPQSQNQMREGGGDGIVGDVGREAGLESQSGTQVDLEAVLIPRSPMREEVEDEIMGDVRRETERESGTQIEVETMLVFESQIGGESKEKEEVGVVQQETSRELDGDARNGDIPMPIDSSIDRFTPRMEGGAIVSFQRMEEEDGGDSFERMEEEEQEEEEQRQGQGQEELDRQMQVDDDGSQLEFENHHHETDHLSAPDLSCQNGQEKNPPSQPLYDSVQPDQSQLPPRNDEVEPESLSPLCLPPPATTHDAQRESSVELSPPPSTQVPNHNLLRESGTAMSPTSSIQMHNRTQQQQQQQQQQKEAAPIVPVALPEYISPVNSPSPTKSPMATYGYARKRKLDDIMMPSLNGVFGGSGSGNGRRRKEQVKQVQLVTPTRSGREKKRMSGVAGDRLGTGNASASVSPDGMRNASQKGGRRVQQGSSKAMVVATPKRKRVVSAMNSREKNGEGRSEENPICLSSTPSTPTDAGGDELPEKRKEKDKGKEREREDPFECIDLTSSPVLTRTQAVKVVKAMEEQRRKGEKGKEKEKEKDQQQGKKEDEKRKKKEKEKRMMPVGMEDSDEAEVIPARAFKAPKVVESTSDGESHNQQGSEKQSNGTARVPILNLSGIRDRQNKAMTKVKRKARPSGNGVGDDAPAGGKKRVVDEGEEPPLKRARGRSDISNADAAVASGSGSSSKGHVGMSTTRTRWPLKRGERRFDRSFVKCDKCSMWYHYGCVGVSMGDDRLKDDVNYFCPPCLASGTVAGSRGTGDSQKNKSRSASTTTEVCARPDCTYKKSSSDEFWVKRIVGRKAKVEGGRGRVQVYLVEWEGYPLGEATWQEEDTMGNPAELIADFARATRKEGIDLDRDANRTVLLKDAQRAGWTTDD